MSDCPHSIDAGAWVLRALPDDEATHFAMHLRGCDRCTAEVARLQLVADALPMVAEQIEPPPALKLAVMDIVKAEAARRPNAARSRAPFARLGELLRRRPVWSAGLAAVAAAAIAVVALTSFDDNGPNATTIQAKLPTLRNAAGRLIVAGDMASVHVSGMPAPGPGRVYQVWIERPAGTYVPTDALFTVSRAGSATVQVPGGVRDAENVLITAEPEGGSQAPTSKPVFIAAAHA